MRNRKGLSLGAWFVVLSLAWAVLLVIEGQFRAATTPTMVAGVIALGAWLRRRFGVSA